MKNAEWVRCLDGDLILKLYHNRMERSAVLITKHSSGTFYCENLFIDDSMFLMDAITENDAKEEAEAYIAEWLEEIATIYSRHFKEEEQDAGKRVCQAV